MERATWRFAGVTRNTVLLALSSLFGDISTEMLYPVLPIFLTQTLGASGSIVGLIEGIAGAMQNVVQGISGTLSDRLRRRKPVALAGFLLAALAKPLMGTATIWQGALGGRLLDRIGAGTRSAPRDALIAASVDEENRGRAFGLESAGDNAGAFIGPLLAILLLVIWQLDIRWIFYLAVIPGLLAFAMIIFVKERPIEIASKTRIDFSFSRFPEAYWRYLLVTMLFGIGNSSNAFLILEVKNTGASLTMTILIYAGFNLVAALISYPAGFLSDRWGRRNLLLTAFAVFFVTYAGFAFSQNVMVIGLLFGFYGLYQGMFRAVGKAFASDLVPSEMRAGGVGWYTATVGLSGLLASLVAGQLWDRVGHQSVFLFGAVFAAVGGAALLILKPVPRKSSKAAP